MPYQGLSDGFYLVNQKSKTKGVTHFGILDIGNRFRHPEVNPNYPTIIHQTPPRLQMDYLVNTGNWTLMGQFNNESIVQQRLQECLRNPKYNLFFNNCEHLINYIAKGTKESKQIQAVVCIGGLLALSIMALKEKEDD